MSYHHYTILPKSLHQISTNKQWTKRQTHQSLALRQSLIIMNDNNLWYSSAHKSIYNQSENGMTEYDINSDKILQTIQYPLNIKPCRQFCVKYKQQIYIIDGENGEIILFNPTTKQFTEKLNIPIIGRYPSAAVMFDYIHIFNGHDNTKHIIYHIPSNTMKVFDTPSTSSMMNDLCILQYKNRIIKFGGFKQSTDNYMSEILMSSGIKDDYNQSIKWIVQPQWAFKHTLYGCGCMIFKHWIITFGGKIYDDINECIDTIYLLDLNKDIGWIKLKHIKCPLKSRYLAVLTHDFHVHLFSSINKWPNFQDSIVVHYSIHISDIFGSIFNGNGVGDDTWEWNEEEMKDMDKIEIVEDNDKKNEEDYIDWSGNDIVDWICGLNKMYEKYADNLRFAFGVEWINGKCIAKIDKERLKGWGIIDCGDMMNIYNHLQRLITN